MTGTLYVVATPIGNLSDITYRAVETLKTVKFIAAEDTRVTGKLLKKYGIETSLVSYREQNAAKAVPKLILSLQAGDDIALVSDAGTPSISDPGFELLEAAHNAGIKVTPIPGPSALSAAISISPLKGEGVRFLGFLPRKGRERKERLQSIADDRSLIIIYESPHRLNSTLTDFINYCSDSRKVMVAREISKLYEEIKIGTFEELAKYFQHNVKGEIVIAIEGSQTPENPVITDDELESIIREELRNNKSAKDISLSLSKFSGIKKRKIYNLAVKLQNNQ